MQAMRFNITPLVDEDLFTITIIGSKNHAERIRDCLVKIAFIDKIFVYHPDSLRLPQSNGTLSDRVVYSSDWSLVSNSQAFFVASPSNTHVEYIKEIFQKCCYIYCEKPPAVSTSELKWLWGNRDEISRLTYFGFNYRHTSFFNAAKELISSGEIGEPIHAHFNVTHGLAFKKGAETNWRFTDPSIFSRITGNLGIHYIDMCLGLFGSVVDYKCIEKKAANHTEADTVNILLTHEKNISANIFLSYATVFSHEAKVFFTNGILSLSEGRLEKLYPRDAFDIAGNFCAPKPALVNALGSSREHISGLTASIEYFLTIARSRRQFDPVYFQSALDTTKLLLDIQGESG